MISLADRFSQTKLSSGEIQADFKTNPEKKGKEKEMNNLKHDAMMKSVESESRCIKMAFYALHCLSEKERARAVSIACYADSEGYRDDICLALDPVNDE